MKFTYTIGHVIADVIRTFLGNYYIRYVNGTQSIFVGPYIVDDFGHLIYVP